MANTTSSADSSFAKDIDPGSNAQGQAALLLIESLIHSLLDNGALTKSQALEAIRSALEVKEESVDDHKEPRAVLKKSLRLLTDLENSIEAHSGRYDHEASAGPQHSQQG